MSVGKVTTLCLFVTRSVRWLSKQYIIIL